MLIYDGDCGFCTACARWVERHLRTPVTVVPWQEVDDLGELGLTRDEVASAAWWVDVFGRRRRGHEAVAHALRMCGAPWRPVGAALLVPPVSWLAATGYLLVSRVRHRLPGSTEACRLPRKVSFQP